MTLEQSWPSARVKIASIPVDYSGVSLAKLIEACVNRENAAWQEFIRRYNRIIAITVARVARHWGEHSPHVVDDLVQEAYLKLCADRARVLREFRFDHPDAIFAFLKVVAANVAHDYFKRVANKTHGGDQSIEPLQEGMEPAVTSGSPAELTLVERAVLLDEVDACLRALLPPQTRDRDLKIFWLSCRHGLTAREISLLPLGLSVKGVESTLRRVVQLVRRYLVDGMGGAPLPGRE